MATPKFTRQTRSIALLLMVCGLLPLTGSNCVQPKEKPEALTGSITVVEQKEVASQATGQVSIVIQKKEEIAERSVVDKGANSLMTAQRIVNAAVPFSSYQVGSEDRIVASLYNQEGRNGSDIWVFSGGNKTRITNTNYFNDYPNFSADGRYIYFSSTRNTSLRGTYDQNCYIWKMVASGGGGITRIGTPVFAYADIEESPDGKHLLFGAREFFGNSDFIWYSAPNGNLPTQLTQGQDAKWMGTDQIVFSTKDENSGLYAIWTVKIDGTELTQIISDPELNCISPAASPDGKHIAYVKQKTGDDNESTRDIFVYTIDSGLSQQITTNNSRDDLPRWSLSGDALFFRSTRGVSWNIWKISTKFLEDL